MKKFNYLDTILSPNVTEKSTSLSEQNKIVFKVPNKSNKKILKKNIEKIFKVNVIKINKIKPIFIRYNLNKYYKTYKSK